MQSGLVEDLHASNPTKLSRSERLALSRKLSENWRLSMGAKLESHYAHAAVLLLIFLDVATVLMEVVVREVCPQPTGGFVYGTWEYQRLHVWGESLAWISRSILFILLIHQLALIACFGCSYFKKLAYVIDLAIVAVALALEMTHLALEIQEENSHSSGAGGHDEHHETSAHTGPEDGTNLIIVLLVWRIVRVIHGFTVTAEAHTEDSELREAKATISELEKELAKLRKAPPPGEEKSPLADALARSVLVVPGSATYLRIWQGGSLIDSFKMANIKKKG